MFAVMPPVVVAVVVTPDCSDPTVLVLVLALVLARLLEFAVLAVEVVVECRDVDEGAVLLVSLLPPLLRRTSTARRDGAGAAGTGA